MCTLEMTLGIKAALVSTVREEEERAASTAPGSIICNPASGVCSGDGRAAARPDLQHRRPAPDPRIPSARPRLPPADLGEGPK